MGLSIFLFLLDPGMVSGLHWRGGSSMLVYTYMGWPVVSDRDRISGLCSPEVGPFLFTRDWYSSVVGSGMRWENCVHLLMMWRVLCCLHAVWCSVLPWVALAMHM